MDGRSLHWLIELLSMKEVVTDKIIKQVVTYHLSYVSYFFYYYYFKYF